MKCICELAKEGRLEKILMGNWVGIYMTKEDDEYYMKVIAGENACIKLNYCPKCGRKLKEDDE